MGGRLEEGVKGVEGLMEKAVSERELELKWQLDWWWLRLCDHLLMRS